MSSNISYTHEQLRRIIEIAQTETLDESDWSILQRAYLQVLREMYGPSNKSINDFISATERLINLHTRKNTAYLTFATIEPFEDTGDTIQYRIIVYPRPEYKATTIDTLNSYLDYLKQQGAGNIKQQDSQAFLKYDEKLRGRLVDTYSFNTNTDPKTAMIDQIGDFLQAPQGVRASVREISRPALAARPAAPLAARPAPIAARPAETLAFSSSDEHYYEGVEFIETLPAKQLFAAQPAVAAAPPGHPPDRPPGGSGGSGGPPAPLASSSSIPVSRVEPAKITVSYEDVTDEWTRVDRGGGGDCMFLSIVAALVNMKSRGISLQSGAHHMAQEFYYGLPNRTDALQSYTPALRTIIADWVRESKPIEEAVGAALVAITGKPEDEGGELKQLRQLVSRDNSRVYEKYKEFVTKTTRWGDQQELQAIANLFKISIWIVKDIPKRSYITIVPKTYQALEKIFDVNNIPVITLYQIGETHYQELQYNRQSAFAHVPELGEEPQSLRYHFEHPMKQEFIRTITKIPCERSIADPYFIPRAERCQKEQSQTSERPTFSQPQHAYHNPQQQRTQQQEIRL